MWQFLTTSLWKPSSELVAHWAPNSARPAVADPMRWLSQFVVINHVVLQFILEYTFGPIPCSYSHLNQESTCSELRAVSEKNKTKKGYDSTGVVAVACARHGFFAPGGMVDMQKGERSVTSPCPGPIKSI